MSWFALFGVPLVCVLLGAAVGLALSARASDPAQWRIRGPLLGAGFGWFAGLALGVPLRAVGVLAPPPCTGILDRELVERIGGETALGKLSAASEQRCELSVIGDEVRQTLAVQRGQDAWTTAIAELDGATLLVGSAEARPEQPRVYARPDGTTEAVFGSAGGMVARLDGPAPSEAALEAIALRLHTVVFPAMERR